MSRAPTTRIKIMVSEMQSLIILISNRCNPTTRSSKFKNYHVRKSELLYTATEHPGQQHEARRRGGLWRPCPVGSQAASVAWILKPSPLGRHYSSSSRHVGPISAPNGQVRRPQIAAAELLSSTQLPKDKYWIASPHVRPCDAMRPSPSMPPQSRRLQKHFDAAVADGISAAVRSTSAK